MPMRPGQKRDFARELRRVPTDAESTLWYHLRARRLLGLKFRREVPLGPYVVDFACLERSLVVEVDGGQHNGAAPDAVRDRFLAGLGFTVLRFWNNEVLFGREVVLQLIADAAAANAPMSFSRTLLPSPASGRRCPKGG